MPKITGREKGDRLAIILTSDKEDKLLKIPMLIDGTGESIAQAVFDAQEEWKIADLVEMICFDTTSSNTGPIKGAAARLEHRLDRDLLHFPCRRHISELLVRSVFELYFGKTSCPIVPEFDKFCRLWHSINTSDFESGMRDEIVSAS